MEFEFNKPRFLLCEGDDDKFFLEVLIRERGLPEFQICHAAECNEAGSDGKGVGGRSGFKHSLSGLSPIKGFSEVRGLLIVSDNDKANSFAEVQEALQVNGHTPPASAIEVGAIHGKPVIVMMIPSHLEYGDLEKVSFSEIVRVWPKAEECVSRFLECTGANAWEKKSSINKARARSATVGFNEAEPYMGIGRLFQKGVLSVANPCFDSIADFLRAFDAKAGT